MASATNVNPTVEEPERTTVVETQVVPAPIPKVNVWQVKQNVKTTVVPGPSLPAPKKASEKETKKKQRKKRLL
ncbi:unnamed protein product [Cunninghamella echinulata]